MPLSALQPLIAALEEGVVVCDAQHRLVEWNREAAAILGLPVTVTPGAYALDALGLLTADLSPLPPEELPSALALAQRAPVLRRRLALRREHAHYRDVVISAVPLFDAKGEAAFVAMAMLDVTRELTVVSELRVMERFFELSDDILLVTDAAYSVLQVNDATLRLLGGTRERYLGQGLWRLVHPEDLKMLLRFDASGWTTREFSTRLRAVSGEWRTIAWQLTRGSAPQGGATFFAHGVDVTARLAERHELSRARELVHDAFELTQLAVLERDLTDGTVTLTSRLRELLGVSDAEVRALEHFVVPEDLPTFRAYAARPERSPGPLTVRVRTDAGDVRAVHAWVQLTSGLDGQPLRELTVVQDVTAQTLAQAQVRLTERLNSLSTMAAGVAHEINNPLSFVMANLNFVGEMLQILTPQPGFELQELRAAVNEALEGADRVRKIVSSMTPFGRTDDHQRAACDVTRVVQASLNLMRNDLRHRARVLTDLKAVSPVYANEARLSQVVLNLLANAARAIPDGHASANEVRVTTREEDGHAVITVQDTGVGISPDVLPRIFDPFFTTRPAGEGMGLGLFLSRGIVQESGGTLDAESTSGQGARFTVKLPLASVAARAPKAASALGKLKILVVDDEPAILRSVQRLLSRRHDVSVARSGQEALDMLADAAFDVVLCDLMMPALSGMEVWERVDAAQRRRMVFMTGGTFTERAHDFIATHAPEVLMKPFTPADLEEVLVRVQSR